MCHSIPISIAVCMTILIESDSESSLVLPEELPESFWMALTFTLIVAMIGIIYTILQGIIWKESKFPGNRCFEIFQKYRNSQEIDYLKNLEKSEGIALLKYLQKVRWICPLLEEIQKSERRGTRTCPNSDIVRKHTNGRTNHRRAFEKPTIFNTKWQKLWSSGTENL